MMCTQFQLAFHKHLAFEWVTLFSIHILFMMIKKTIGKCIYKQTTAIMYTKTGNFFFCKVTFFCSMLIAAYDFFFILFCGIFLFWLGFHKIFDSKFMVMFAYCIGFIRFIFVSYFTFAKIFLVCFFFYFFYDYY